MDLSFLGSNAFRIAALILFTIIAGTLVGARTGFTACNEGNLEETSQSGSKRAKRLLVLKEKSGCVLSCMIAGERLVSFVLIAFSTAGLYCKLAHQALLLVQRLFGTQLIGYFYYKCASILLLALISTFVYYIFCYLVPKKLALQNPLKTALLCSGVIRMTASIMKPFYKSCMFFSNVFVKMLGQDPHSDEEKVTEEGIRMMVDAGEEGGVLEDSQREMINNIFEFDDINAGDIMTHRTDIEAVEADAEIQDAVNVSIKAGCSRIPVYEEDLDNIVGVIYVKDLLKFIGEKLTKGTSLRELLRPALFVPETVSCGKLFTKMTEERIQMAIVVDEYGGTAGLVTMEDLLESIVGSIQDEYDDEDEEFSKIDEKTYTFDGVTDIEEFQEIVGVVLPEGDYDTLAGFVISLLGYIPSGHNESVSYENLTFTVLSVEDRRIDQIRVEIDKPADEPEKTEEKTTL